MNVNQTLSKKLKTDSEQIMTMIGRASESDAEVDLMPEEPPIVMYCMKQISFLTREVDRLEDELASKRAAHCKEIKRVWQKVRQSAQKHNEELHNVSTENVTESVNSNEHKEKEESSTNNIPCVTNKMGEDEEKVIAAERYKKENAEQISSVHTPENYLADNEERNCDNKIECQTCEEVEKIEHVANIKNSTHLKETHLVNTSEHNMKEVGNGSGSSRDDSSSLLTHDLTKSELDVECNSSAEEEKEWKDKQREEQSVFEKVKSQGEKLKEHEGIVANLELKKDVSKDAEDDVIDSSKVVNDAITNVEKLEIDVLEGCELIDIAVQSENCNVISTHVQTDDQFLSDALYSSSFVIGNNNNADKEHAFSETDRLRAKLSEVCAAHRKAVETIKQLTNRLQNEYNERQVLISDNTQIVSELELLQKQIVQEINVQASMQSRIDEMQAAHQHVCNTVQVLESEKEELQRRLKLHENNLEQLSNERVHMYNELECIGRDNEQMNVALQSANARASRLNEELHVKDAELHEVLEVYHSCLRESEIVASHNAQLLMQLDALKGQLAYQEQQLICHEEEQTMMQSKEVQLVSDVQLMTYDTEQLQRRLADSEERVMQLEHTCQELTQTNEAKDCQLRTFDNSCAQLHKQLMLYEEELECYRNDRAEFEQRVQSWQERANIAENKLSSLENKHAQLLTQHVLLASSNKESSQKTTLEQCKQEIKELKADVRTREVESVHLQEECDELRAQMHSLQQELADAHESKTRLQKIVMEQANTLSELSREEKE